MFVLEGDTVWQKVLSLTRRLLPLPRFDLFLQGALLVLTLYDGYAYLLLRRSASAGLLSPRIEDWVSVGAAGAELALGATLGWLGGLGGLGALGGRQRGLGGWLLLAAAPGLVALAFPQPALDTPFVELCDAASPLVPPPAPPGGSPLVPPPAPPGGSPLVPPPAPPGGSPLVPPPAPPGGSPRSALIIITAILCSLARVSIWTHGITYLDDHDPANAAYYYGILISIRVSVGINARNWLEAHSRGPDWWKGQLSLAMLTLMFGVLFLLFPDRIKGWPLPPQDNMSKKDSEFFYTLKRLLRNKALMVQAVALGLINAGVWGFIMNERAYTQARYQFEAAPDWSDGRNSRVVGDILRTFVIVFLVAVFRARFSGRRTEGVKATTAAKVGAVLALLAAGFFTLLALLRCEPAPLAGVRAQAGAARAQAGAARYSQPACSQQCGCSSEQYGFAPVCVLAGLTTYFSPCHAGCSSSEDLNGFMVLHNCSCGAAGAARAVRGPCGAADCQFIFSVYQIVYVNALAISAAALLMQGMCVLRATRPRDRPAALGLALGLAGALGGAATLLYSCLITDATCVYREGGSCLLHREALAGFLAASSAALALSSAVLSAAAFRLARRQERGARQLAT